MGKTKHAGPDAVPVTRATSAEALLREIPSVDEVLNQPAIQDLSAETGRAFVTERVRGVLASLRQEIHGGRRQNLAEADVETAVREAVEKDLAYSLQPVINATGVILHTNLGRAPLSREALEYAMEIATQYSNLEYDLDSGHRGERDVHISQPLEQLLGSPAAIAVNNNAAAVMITLNTLAEGGEVIVSRGELIEIGGSFRIPDVMQKSGALLREVGTTNRTRIGDYQKAINEKTKLLLRVHPSNFRIVGFTERPALEEMTELAKKSGIPLYEDLGSGCLVPASVSGVQEESLVTASLAAGVDVVSFSGDKMLGGPQAGIIAGKKDLIAQIRRNPLFRALRVDKLTYAVLAATLQAYRQGQLHRIPAWRMILTTVAELEQRAKRLVQACQRDGLRMEIIDGESVIGGGSAPGWTIPTRLIALHQRETSAADLEQRLRGRRPPIIARTESDTVLLDLRTVFPEQEEALAQALLSVASS